MKKSYHSIAVPMKLAKGKGYLLDRRAPPAVLAAKPLRAISPTARLRNKRTLVAPRSLVNAPNPSADASRRASYVPWSEPEGELHDDSRLDRRGCGPRHE